MQNDCLKIRIGKLWNWSWGKWGKWGKWESGIGAVGILEK